MANCRTGSCQSTCTSSPFSVTFLKPRDRGLLKVYDRAVLGGTFKVSPSLHSARTLRVRQHLTVRMQSRAFLLVYMENWKPIPGYEGRYEVSDQGNVKSFRRSLDGYILRPGRMPGGHLSVALGRLNSQCVHKLVLLAFVGPAPVHCECLHQNGIPSDNRLVNLRWGTRSENMKDAYAHGARNMVKQRAALDKGRATRWGHA